MLSLLWCINPTSFSFFSILYKSIISICVILFAKGVCGLVVFVFMDPEVYRLHYSASLLSNTHLFNVLLVSAHIKTPNKRATSTTFEATTEIFPLAPRNLLLWCYGGGQSSLLWCVIRIGFSLYAFLLQHDWICCAVNEFQKKIIVIDEKWTKEYGSNKNSKIFDETFTTRRWN